MIVYDLRCAGGHIFEAWFGSRKDYETQKDRDLVACPFCESTDIERTPSALAISSGAARSDADMAAAAAMKDAPQAKGATPPSPEAVKTMLAALARAQSEAVAKSEYVGSRFAEEARAMHYGEQEHRSIYGETGAGEAKELREEGVAAFPLLFPVRPRSDA